MSRHEKYSQAVLKINAMRAALRKDPTNKELAKKIQEAEENLYSEELSKSDDELSRFLRLYGIETNDDED